MASPRVARLGPLSTPAQREVGEIFQTWVSVDGVMQATHNWFTLTGHAVAKKLPSPIVTVMRNEGDRFGTFMNGVGQESRRMG